MKRKYSEAPPDWCRLDWMVFPLIMSDMQVWRVTSNLTPSMAMVSLISSSQLSKQKDVSCVKVSSATEVGLSHNFFIYENRAQWCKLDTMRMFFNPITDRRLENNLNFALFASHNFKTNSFPYPKSEDPLLLVCLL